ncbi:hypothetical protein HKX48_002349, partial [Thoreauomyces humboldtii]
FCFRAGHTVALSFLTLLLVVFSYDIPAALNVPLKNWLQTPYQEYQWKINLLYTVYSLPNVILPLVGGLLVDNLSATTMLIVFMGFVAFGQMLFATGIAVRSFPLMVVGRVVFGAGGESLEVASSRITTEWFKGRGLGFAMSLHLSMARIAAACNDNLSPLLADLVSVPFAVWFGLVVCALSFGCALAMVLLDRPASRAAARVVTERVVVPTGRAKANNHQGESQRRRPSQEIHEETPLLLDTPSVQMSYETLPHDLETRSNPDLFAKSSSSATLGDVKDEDEDEGYDEDGEQLRFSQLRGLNASFWMLCLVTIGLYGSSVPFFHICTDFFEQKWYPGDSQAAGMVMSIPDIVSACGSPLCGLYVDHYGHRSTLLPIAGVLVFITHALLAYTTLTPVVAMVILGIAYSIFASALWACVGYLVGPHQIATAYGLLSVSLNTSLALLPLAVAKVRVLYPTSFVPVEIFFMALSLVSIALSTILCIVDIRAGGILRSPNRITHLHHTHQGPDHSASEATLPDIDNLSIRDDDNNSDDDDDESYDQTIKAIGDGVVVTVPRTHIHHNHSRHGPDERCTCVQDNGARIGSASSSSSHSNPNPNPNSRSRSKSGSRPTAPGSSGRGRGPPRDLRNGAASPSSPSSMSSGSAVSPTRRGDAERLHHRGLRAPPLDDTDDRVASSPKKPTSL